MPRAQFDTLQVPTSVTVGAPRNVEDLTDKSVQFIGPFVANLDLEGSLDPDGLVWGAIQTGINAPQIVQVPGTYRQLRVRTTSFTSGTPVAFLGSRNDRTR